MNKHGLGRLGWVVLAAAALGLGVASWATDTRSPQDVAREVTAKWRAVRVEGAASESASLWANQYNVSGPGWTNAGLVAVASDGGYYLTGTTTAFGAGGEDLTLLKLDAAGAVQWAYAYGTSSDDAGRFIAAPDGGFVSLVSTGSLTTGGTVTYGVIKVNSSGAVQWQKTLGTSATISAYGVAPASDGTYVYGSPSLLSGMGNSFFVLKLDSSGNTLWQNKYTSSDTSILFIPVLEVQNDGSVTVSGEVVSFTSGSSDLFAVRLDASGSVLFQDSYGGPGTEAEGIMVRTSGGFLLEGVTTSWGQGGQDGDFWLLQLDNTGAIQWQKAYGGPGATFGLANPQSDGSIIVGGSTSAAGAGGIDALCMKLDSSGNVTWQETIGGAEDDAGALLPDPNGGYLVEGATKSFGGGSSDFWLLKLDASGAVSWGNTYGGTQSDEGYALRLGSGDMFVSGNSSTTPTNISFWDVLADAQGNVGDACEWIHPLTVAAAASALVTTPTNAQATPLGLTTSAGTLQVTAGSLSTTTGTFTSTSVCSAEGGGCTYGLSPTSKDFAYKAGSESVTVTASGQGSCGSPAITVSDSWVTASLSGYASNKGTVKVSVTQNPSASSRSAEVTVGGAVFAVSQDGAPCKLTAVSPKKLTVASSGGDQSVAVTATAGGCDWTATPNGTAGSWITMTTGSGSGPGNVTFTVSPNTTGKKRTGTISVAVAAGKKTITVKQSA